MASHLRLIRTIIGKDLRQFARDRFFLFVTVLGLVFYVGMFWVLPDTVDEILQLGVSGDFALQGAGPGIDLAAFESEEALRAAVAEGADGILAGLAFPAGFVPDLRAGRSVTVTMYVGAGIPAGAERAVGGFVEEIGYFVAGIEAPSSLLTEVTVVGVDRAGDPVSLRERFRPMFAFLVLLVESLALASLVSAEIHDRTVTAVLVTPASVGDFLSAKVVLGTALAFTEAVVLLAALSSLGSGVVALLVALFLGAVLVTGFALIAGSTGKDFIGIVFWSMLFLFPLLIPAVAALFPGAAAPWVRVLPSFGLVEAIVAVTVDGEGLADVAGYLAVVAMWCVAVLGAGLLVLRRRVVAL